MKQLYIIFFLSISLIRIPSYSQDLLNKVHTGYQGWFTCPGDGSGLNRWNHWGKNNDPLNSNTITVDMIPDMTEYTKIYTTPSLTQPNNQRVKFFSSYDYSTVDLHFKWMKQYGIDGVFIQRFFINVHNVVQRNRMDKVLEHAIIAAKKYNRKIAIMYDLTGADKNEISRDVNDFHQKINEDWNRLHTKYELVRQSCYMKEENKPVLAFWGIGIHNRDENRNIRYANDVLRSFKGSDHDYFRNTYMVAGTGSRWRTLGADMHKRPIWNELLKQFDMVSPWSVGRYDNTTYPNYLETVTRQDVRHLNQYNNSKPSAQKVDYMPVVFPGFSWHNKEKNLKGNNNFNKHFNQVPRNRGDFFYRQLFYAKKAGAKCVYIAMFDEVDEGTAIFKLAPNQSKVPKQGNYVSLDAEGRALPSDWYLKIVRHAGPMYRSNANNMANLPTNLRVSESLETANTTSTVADESFNLLVYPNPATENIAVEFTDYVSNGEVQIYDMTYLKVFNQSVSEINSGESISVNISELNSGLYMLVLKSERGITKKKFFVN